MFITVLAATTVAVAGLTRAEEVSLSGLYLGLATIVVWFPVALYVVLGKRADTLLTTARGWIVTREEWLTVVSASVVGLLLIGDALAALFL